MLTKLRVFIANIILPEKFITMDMDRLFEVIVKNENIPLSQFNIEPETYREATAMNFGSHSLSRGFTQTIEELTTDPLTKVECVNLSVRGFMYKPKDLTGDTEIKTDET